VTDIGEGIVGMFWQRSAGSKTIFGLAIQQDGEYAGKKVKNITNEGEVAQEHKEKRKSKREMMIMSLRIKNDSSEDGGVGWAKKEKGGQRNGLGRREDDGCGE